MSSPLNWGLQAGSPLRKQPAQGKSYLRAGLPGTQYPRPPGRPSTHVLPLPNPTQSTARAPRVYSSSRWLAGLHVATKQGAVLWL